MTVRRSVILGCGSYLPSHVLTNDELALKVDTSDEWIVQRTGIHERRIAAAGELTSDLALIASAQKVEHYEIAGYKNAHCLAKQTGQREVAKLLAHTLGEEESTDFLLSTLAKPLLQQALSVEVGNGTKAPWGEPGDSSDAKPATTQTKVAAAAAGGISRLKAHKAKA